MLCRNCLVCWCCVGSNCIVIGCCWIFWFFFYNGCVGLFCGFLVCCLGSGEILWFV